MNKYIPDGWHSITPRIVADDVPQLCGFLEQVFYATIETRREPCQIRIGDSLVMLSSAGVREVMPAFLYLYVEDTDATYGRALSAGAESIEEPADMAYGDRRAMIKDPGGNIWQIATHDEAAFQMFLQQS